MKKLSKISMMLTMALVLTVLFSSVGFSKVIDEYDQYLIKSLKDENIGVRSSAAQLIGDRRVEAAVKPLIKMLKTEKSYACRIVAAKALYDIGNQEALPVLKKVASHDKNKTVRRVVTAIVKEMENVSFAKK